MQNVESNIRWSVKIGWRRMEYIVIGGDRERRSHSVSILGEYTILMPLREHLQTPIYHAGSRNEGDLCAEISDRELRERNNFSELLPGLCGCLSMNESHFGLDRDSFPCERSFVPLPRYIPPRTPTPNEYSVRGINRIRRPSGGISPDISFIVHAYKWHSIFHVPCTDRSKPVSIILPTTNTWFIYIYIPDRNFGIRRFDKIDEKSLSIYLTNGERRTWNAWQIGFHNALIYYSYVWSC